MIALADKKQTLKILIAEDDDDDFTLAVDTLQELGVPSSNVQRVYNGQELIDYLNKQGGFTSNELPKPDLILLDLNMPVKSGREALAHIRSNSKEPFPIAVLSTSSLQEDIEFCYKNCVNSYIVKEGSLDKYTKKMRTLVDYWTNVSELPRNKSF